MLSLLIRISISDSVEECFSPSGVFEFLLFIFYKAEISFSAFYWELFFEEAKLLLSGIRGDEPD